jgi:hypothetical protein
MIVDVETLNGLDELEWLRYLEQKVQYIRKDLRAGNYRLAKETTAQVKFALNHRIVKALEARQ